jgi:hypothetical protein
MIADRLRLFTASVLACLLCLAAPASRADGPVIPVPIAVQPTWVLRHLVESGVRIPREQALAAVQAYVDGLEQATVQAIDAGKGALSDSVDDLRRRQDLANRASDAAALLRNELFGALAAAARPEDRPVVDAVRANEAVQAAITEVQGQVGIIYFRMPDDLGGWLMPMGKWGGTPEEYRHRVLLAATNADARVAALVLARKRRSSHCSASRGDARRASPHAGVCCGLRAFGIGSLFDLVSGWPGHAHVRDVGPAQGTGGCDAGRAGFGAGRALGRVATRSGGIPCAGIVWCAGS